MKHIESISLEFLHIARHWDDMNREEQRDYIDKHTKSKKTVSAPMEGSENSRTEHRQPVNLKRQQERKPQNKIPRIKEKSTKAQLAKTFDRVRTKLQQKRIELKNQ